MASCRCCMLPSLQETQASEVMTIDNEYQAVLSRQVMQKAGRDWHSDLHLLKGLQQGKNGCVVYAEDRKRRPDGSGRRERAVGCNGGSTFNGLSISPAKACCVDAWHTIRTYNNRLLGK